MSGESKLLQSIQSLSHEVLLQTMHDMEKTRLALARRLHVEPDDVDWPSNYKDITDEAQKRKLCL